MKTSLALLFAVFAAGCDAPESAAKTTPKHVLIIRHAEKPPESAGEAGLNAAGKARAAKLHELFEKTDARPEPFPKPDFLFAAAVSKMSRRSIDTAQPLGKDLQLAVNEKFDDDNVVGLAAELRKPKYDGKTVMIVWKHHAIAPLAAKLGATDAPKEWKDGVFDRVWQLDYADGKVTFHDRPQGIK